ncbi:MAG: O-antigen ligase family protein [Nocardioidaceae bacterium]
MAKVFRRFRPYDATSVLSVFLLLLFAVPSSQVFVPLGSAGSPAQLLGLLMLAAWTYYQVQRPSPTRAGHQPVRWAFFIVVACFTASFVVAMNRPIASAESSVAITGMVSLCGWAGLLLTANDGIDSWPRFLTLVRRMVFGASCVAALGIVQFATGQLWINRLWFPGLNPNPNQPLTTLVVRNGLIRPPGTALHPIEFGAVVTMALPMALTLAVQDRSRGVVRRWAPALLLGMGAVLCGSRSAILSGAVGLVILFACWSGPLRRRALVGVVAFTGLIALAVPGMLGALYNLFMGISTDNSAASRTGSYPLAETFIRHSPLFGRGFSTFLPSYRVLDNGWLGLAIEVGLAGFTAFLALILTGMWAGQRVRWAADGDELIAQVGQALTAGIAAGAAGLAFYDGMSFPMGATMIFLLLGMAGGLRRLMLTPSRDPAVQGASAEPAR